MSKRNIAIIGGLTQRIIAEVDHMPDMGQTIETSTFGWHCGGRGAFSAVSAYRLSHYQPSKDQKDPATCVLKDGDVEVKLIGAVGDDPIGRKLKEEVSNLQVKTEHVRLLPDKRTSMAFVVVDEDSKEQLVFFCPGANHGLKASDFESTDQLIEECGGSKPDILMTDSELERNTVQRIIYTADAAHIPVLLHMVPICHLFSDYYKRLTHLVIHRGGARELFPNVSPPDDEGDPHAWERLAREFLHRGVTNVVIMLGTQGAYYSNLFGKKGHVPGRSVEITNRVGSGETFTAAYAVECIKRGPSAGRNDWDIHTAVRRSCIAASLSLQHDGCLYPIRWADDVEKEYSKIT